MEYSITNMFAEKMTENVYVKAFVQGAETEQRELPPVVSVLLPSYNHEKYIEAAVRSVMSQKGVSFELIVIDGGSTDGTLDIIKKYYSNYSDQEDIISIGTIGLIKAINTFDYTKGTRLATYASRCIENEIFMHFRVRKKNAQEISMDEPIDTDSEGNPLTFTDIIYSTESVFDDVELKMQTEKLYSYIDAIKDQRKKQILIMRYGLYDTEPLTQREIAQKLGISRSYVSRIETKAIEELRDLFDVNR